MLIIILVLLILDISLILFLYFKGRDRYVPRVKDDEYEEFMEWINKKRNKEKWKK